MIVECFSFVINSLMKGRFNIYIYIHIYIYNFMINIILQNYNKIHEFII